MNFKNDKNEKPTNPLLNVAAFLRRAAGRLRTKRVILAKAGYYAALVCLLALLGSASYAYRSQGQTPREEPARQAVQRTEPALQAFLPEPTPEPARWIWPLEGEIVGAYSPDAPVWSSTLTQWQTHAGLDIAGSPGEAVYACADGTVADAWKDALWGNVIVIDHGDGYRSTYASVNTLNLVRAGDAVCAGDVISAVGQSAACESELGWHLHFALERDGEPVDFEALTREIAN